MAEFTSFLTYPLLFLALFFEVFVILTFFEKDAKRRRSLTGGAEYPSVSVIIPSYNEATTLSATVDSVLALDYPKEKLSVILVDDGSTDDTPIVMARYAENPQITVIRKENGGKHTALNAGLAAAKSEFIACLDADSFVTKEALKRIIANFDAPDIGAVTSSMSVHEPKTILEKMQEAEYLFGIMLRHSLATLNGLYVTPGPFTVFRKKVFEELGPFRPAHQTEDMEIALRLQKAGWRIQNAPNASVFTKVPKTVGGLVKQRTRWTTGFLRNSADYRELFLNPRMGVVGMFVLPFAVFSVFSIIALFFLALIRGAGELGDTIAHFMEVPVTLSIFTHWTSWFFMPVTAMSVLSVLTLLIVFGSVMVGARIGHKETRLGLTFLWYFLLYMTIATIWQIRAVADVAMGTRRSWR